MSGFADQLISEAQRATIVELAREGMSVHEIASRAGCSRNTVFKYAEREGLGARVRRRRPRLTPEQVDHLLALAADGVATEVIAVELGCTTQTVLTWLRRSGAPRRLGSVPRRFARRPEAPPPPSPPPEQTPEQTPEPREQDGIAEAEARAWAVPGAGVLSGDAVGRLAVALTSTPTLVRACLEAEGVPVAGGVGEAWGRRLRWSGPVCPTGLLEEAPRELDELPRWFAGLPVAMLRRVWVAAVVEAVEAMGPGLDRGDMSQLVRALVIVRERCAGAGAFPGAGALPAGA